MRKTILLLLILVQALIMAGKGTVSFQLDLDPLVKENHFSPEKDHRVFVRGSFNNWQGNNFELLRKEGGNLFVGSFEVEGNAGDTIAYKYVIEKGKGRFFWEERPDPSNPDHGNRRLVLPREKLVLPVATFHHNEYFSFPVVFTQAKLQADFKQFRSILEGTHPALYDYTEKAVLDSLFDLNYSAIQGDMSFRNFLMLMTEVISQVGCGHSSLWIPGTYWAVAPPS